MSTTQKAAGKQATGKRSQSSQAPDNFNAPGDFNSMVAEAAYYLAEQRGFSPGYEMDDWLAAEAHVRNLLTHH